jgi:predicted component of viral defense system (DUF524 family)
MENIDQIESIDIYIDGFNLKCEIIAVKDGNTLYRLSEEDALLNGEAIVQILEGCSYEYVLSNPDYRLSADVKGIVNESKKDKNRGTISPNTYVGTLSLYVCHFQQNDRKHRLKLEVLATKFDIEPDQSYRKNYRKMLEDITEKSTDLLLQSGTPVVQNFETDYGKDNITLYQRFCFVRSIVDSKEFNESVSRIIASPKTTWKEEPEKIDIGRVKRYRSGEIRQLLAKGNRIPLPENHHLRQIGLSSVPRRISTSKKIDTVDNPENRFIKHALEHFLNFTERCKSIFSIGSREYLESVQLSGILEAHLSNAFFKEISRPSTLALNNPVLQRRSGYREVLKSWLMFDLAAKLIWSGGNKVYEGGKRDIATLYEYWLFFALYDLIRKKFGLTYLESDQGKLDNLFKPDKNGINMILKSGNHIALSGIKDFDSRNLAIKFSYNRSFEGFKNGKEYENYKGAGSWSKTLRPDYTLSFWPADLEENDAEIREEIVHIHFDAKYKVDQFDVYLKNDDIALYDDNDSNEDKSNDYTSKERKGSFKNVDLLKMHAYRDAIRRTGGAYVLYPGTEKKEYKGYHEIVPGLGAFAVNPSQEKIGLQNISDFVDRVVQNLLDRSSQRERMASKIFTIHEKPNSVKLNQVFPEYINNKKVLPDETTVIIGYYKSAKHLDWIIKKNLYNFRTGSGTDMRRGSISMTTENVGAKFLILHGKGDIPTSKIYNLSEEGPKIFIKSDLESLGYPDAKGKLYLVYKLSKDLSLEFNHVKFDLYKIKGFAESKSKYGPVTCTLKALFESKVE